MAGSVAKLVNPRLSKTRLVLLRSSQLRLAQDGVKSLRDLSFILPLLVALMYLGRVGPYTLAAAFALRQHPIKFRYAAEAPIIG